MGYDFGGYIVNQASNNAMSSVQDDGYEPSVTPSIQPSNVMKSLDYKPSMRRRSQNFAEFVRKSRRIDPQGAANMQRLVASTDVIGAIDSKMRTIGLRGDNVADAYALWWMLAWYAAQGTEAEPTQAMATAVRDQAERAILATREFKGADDADKQKMAEALLVQAALVDAMNEEYGSDPQMKGKLAKAVNQGAQKMGLDLTAMELTLDGFVMREGASATDRPAVPGGEAPAALAAARMDAGEPVAGGTDLSDYALPALGGTAALAAVFLLGRAAGRWG